MDLTKLSVTELKAIAFDLQEKNKALNADFQKVLNVLQTKLKKEEDDKNSSESKESKN